MEIDLNPAARTAVVISVLVIAVVTALPARAVLVGVALGVWALLLLVNSPLWGVIGIPGLVLVIVLGVVWLVRSRRRC